MSEVTNAETISSDAEQEHEQAVEQDTASVEQATPEVAEQTPEITDPRQAKLEAKAKQREQEITPRPVEQAPEAPTEVEEPEQPTEEPKPHTLKINGKEQQVTESEFLKYAQKGLAADKKFEEAAELRRASEQRVKELEEKLAQQSSQSPPDKDAANKALPDKDVPPVEFTPDALDKAVFAGDEEGQRFRDEMARRLNQQPVDPTSIKEQIRFEMRVEQAIDEVKQADPIAAAILSDDRRAEVANRYSAMLQEIEPNLSERENIERACQQARLHFPDLVAEYSQPEVKATKQVQQTKQAHAAGNVSKPTQRVTVGAAPLSAEQAQAQAKAQLRQARGLTI